MKALTIIQPYAHLIASGEKRVENRTWFCGYRGRLAIHAGKAKKYDGEDVLEIADDYSIPRHEIVFGAIIALADMIDCVNLDRPTDQQHIRHPWIFEHEHASGPYCFVLENVVALQTPIVCSGAQGLWEWDERAVV